MHGSAENEIRAATAEQPPVPWYSAWGWREWLVAATGSFCLMGVSLNAWYWYGPDSWGPRLACRRPIAHLGPVSILETAEAVFVLENTGGEEIVIERVVPACRCSTARLDGVTIPPGGQLSLPVRLQAEDKLGSFTKTFVVRSNSPTNRNLLLSVRGTICPAAAVGDDNNE